MFCVCEERGGVSSLFIFTIAMNYDIILPSLPRIIEENETKGVYEIDGLYPGYGYTVGAVLRRVLLSSLPGAAVTTLKIEGVSHEFSTIEGVKEDVLTILLNLKQIRFRMHSDDPQHITLQVKGPKKVTAADFALPTQVEIVNPDAHIASLTTKQAVLSLEATVEKGLGYIPREMISKEKVDVGVMTLDAIMTPIRRVNYEVENMRVGDRTDYNRLRIIIETNGTITPNDALRRSVEILIRQLQAMIGFLPTVNIVQEAPSAIPADVETTELAEEQTRTEKEPGSGEDPLKIRVEDLNLSSRTLNVLSEAGIRTVGGLVKKREEDLMELGGFGKKSVQEIKRALGYFGLTLKN